MKILVVCQYYYPEPFSVTELCEDLVKEGHSITVLTGLPNYPTGVVPPEYRHGKKRIETINGVTVHRTFEIPRAHRIVKIALNYLSFMITASFHVLFMRKDFDLIFVFQLSPVTMILPGILMKKRSRKPLYVYSLDIWPESIKHVVTDENNIVFKLVAALSRILYSQCDAISVTSSPFIDYFQLKHGIPREKLSYIPQHAEDRYLETDFTPEGETVNFIFLGNIGMAQDIECILNAAGKMKTPEDFRIHFVGDGSALKESKKMVIEKGLQRTVLFHNRQPVSKMPDYYKLADACLLTLKSGNLASSTIPLKLQGYMAAGKPVIAAIEGAARDVIEESGCGICVEPSNSDALAKAMQSFIENRRYYQSCGEKGREYYRKHFRNNLFLKKLNEEFNRLTNVKQ